MFFFNQLLCIGIIFSLGFLYNIYGFELIDQIILLKIRLYKKIDECMNFTIKDECEIIECVLINNDYFFKNKDLNKMIKENENIDKEKFIHLFYHFQLELNEDSSLMIRFKYNNKINRIYIHYKQLNDGYFMKMPIDIESYKKEGLNRIVDGKRFNFQNEFQEISHASINDKDILKEVKEMNGLNHDFGLLNNNKILIKYIKKEFNIEEVEKLQIKYKNFHLDDENMKLIDHEINKKEDYEIIESDILLKCIK